MDININEEDFVNFQDLRTGLEIKDPNLFKVYLKELYKDLADRAESNRKSGISKITFWDYVKINVFIAEKLFMALDRDNDMFLNSKEFTEGMYKLYMGDFYETVEIIFNICDFDKDSYIEKGDVKILLSYLPLKGSNSLNQIEYKYQMESLEEIDELIKQTFGEGKEKMNLAEFTEAVQNQKSDIFLQLLCFLYLNKPFNEENIIIYRNFAKKKSIEEESGIKSLLLDSPNKSPSEKNVRMPSPSRKSRLQPVDSLFKLNFELNEEEGINTNTNTNTNIKPIISSKKLSFSNKDSSDIQLVRMDNTRFAKEKEYSDVKEVIKNSKSILCSPTNYFRGRGDKEVVSDFNLEDNLIKLDDDEEEVEVEEFKINSTKKKEEIIIPEITSENSSKESSSPVNKRDSFISVSPSNSPNTNTYKKKLSILSKKDEIVYENWVMKITDANKLKRYYLVLIGKDIYYYRNEMKEELLGMHNLSGSFVKEGDEKKFDGKRLFSFAIAFSSKTRNYYVGDKNESYVWIKSLKKAIGYQSFFDYYDIKNDLGEGKFGMVKLGVHKKTGEKVAIKIIKKDSMTVSDMELVRSEIDIMKLCKHPNIVRLLDHFENSEYIFIVMEYLAGGDLGDYLVKCKFKFDEKTAANLLLQIGLGIKYLHQYGIVHRDLKPENIMLVNINTPKEEFVTLKIMDFGLSKILGPLEKACDGFGTLSFVAPEVLIRQPYNTQIDIWSMGVILYYMLSGLLPFDDESDNEEIIAKRTVFVELQFPPKNFSERSKEVLDLITKCLIKDPTKRITIDEFIQHDLFKKHNTSNI
jgi:hypothetical protein